MSLISIMTMLEMVNEAEKDICERNVTKKTPKNDPTVDAVEVVRCKDCKHWERSIYVKDFGQCVRVDYDPPATLSVDFCSYGERKDNG